jgi:pantetheine-phosphate adenylyltransferase
MAQINRVLNNELDTVFFPADSRYAHVSSTAVRSIAMIGGDLKNFVPEEILPAIKEKLDRHSQNKG